MAILLASIVLFGCDPVSSGDTDAWIINDNDNKAWEKSNTSTEDVLRAFEGFGTLDYNNGTVVKIEIGNSRVSKAGILLDYKDYSEEAGTVQYYQVGVGTSGYDGATPEYYVTKVTDMTPADINATTTSDSATGGKGTTVDLQNNTALTANHATFSGNKMTIYVGFIKENDAVKIRVGNYDENSQDDVKWVATQYTEYTLPNVTDVNGKLCAYAMLKKSDGTEVSTLNKYTVLNRTGKAADAE